MYPDLPAEMENKIATGDCDNLDAIITVVFGGDAQRQLRFEVLEAVANRADELGCAE